MSEKELEERFNSDEREAEKIITDRIKDKDNHASEILINKYSSRIYMIVKKRIYNKNNSK